VTDEITERFSAALTGRYTIERELGRGGMAVVYLARDERHDRFVAIKVMLPEVVGPDSTERFRREIQIAGRLNHPNILTVFDSGDVDGQFYYVMPFVEGDSLADAIVRAKQLGVEESINIICQVADALDYAHSEGVIHRDIKPANILLARSRPRSGGGGLGRNPLVTDFGIARAMAMDGKTKLTATGLMVGTPTYMSPEQWSGDIQVDGRADQYSLACVLYEMLIGEPPFTGPNPMVVLARHTMEMVPSLRIARPTVPDALEQAIFTAMAKVPADRFETMADFGEAIRTSIEGRPVYSSAYPAVPTGMMLAPTSPGMAIEKAAPTLPPPVRVRRRTPSQRVSAAVATVLSGKHRAIVAGSVLSAALVGAVAGFHFTRPATTDKTKLLVLPFDNSVRGRGVVRDSTFADGLTEEIISRLSGVGRLSVIARASAMQYKKPRKKTLKEIADELGVDRVVTGYVEWTADTTQTIVKVEIVDPDDLTGTELDSFNAENLDDVYRIATAITAKLDLKVDDTERTRLEEHPTDNREAYDAYREGNRFFNHSWDSSDVNAAIRSYERATSLDGNFALAFAALGRAHGWKYQLRYDATQPRLVYAKRAIDSALTLKADLPEAHMARGLYHYWAERDYDRAISEFRTVQKSLPSYADAALNMANVQRRRGLFREALGNYELAAELDPKVHQPRFSGAEAALYIRDFEKAERLTDQVIELAPDFIDGYLLKATLQIHRRGDRAAARSVLAALEERMPGARWRIISHHWRAGLFRIVDDSLPAAERRIVVNTFGLDTAQYYLARGFAYRNFGQAARGRAYFDSAAFYMEATIKRQPNSAPAFGLLGLAYGGLQKKDEAGRAAEEATRILNEKTDALDGPEWIVNVAMAHSLAGNVDQAIAALDKAMRIPSRLSPKWVELDPVWSPLRNDPRFTKLIAQPPPLGTVAIAAK
jgi:serine/threonine protein kinase/TolB-like protein